MSVPIFEVTKSQILDWCQTGRLAGGSDAREGQWLVMQYGCEYKRPLRYVKVFCACDTYNDALRTFYLIGAKPNPVIGWEYEVWHVEPEQVASQTDYVADYDEVSTLIMHWVPALNQYVAVMVERYGVYLPTDWQCLQPRTLEEVLHYDFIPCEEFSDFRSNDYAKVIDACVNAGVMVPC